MQLGSLAKLLQTHKPDMSRNDVQQAVLNSFVDTAPKLTQSDLAAYGMAPSIGMAWAESGFARVSVAHRLAASLICTDYSRVTDLLTPPWRCFAVEPPHGLIPNVAAALVLFPVGGGATVVICRTSGLGIELLMEPNVEALALFATNGARAGEVTGSAGDDELWSESFGSKEFNNESQVTARLVLGVLAELSAIPDDEKSPSRPRGARAAGRARGEEPRSWVMQLTRPVALDLRSAVGDFIRGRGRKLNVQHLVRGHGKRQSYGSGAERKEKVIHVEPYWRGDPDSPVAVRVHKMGSAS